MCSRRSNIGKPQSSRLFIVYELLWPFSYKSYEEATSIRERFSIWFHFRVFFSLSNVFLKQKWWFWMNLEKHHVSILIHVLHMRGFLQQWKAKFNAGDRGNLLLRLMHKLPWSIWWAVKPSVVKWNGNVLGHRLSENIYMGISSTDTTFATDESLIPPKCPPIFTKGNTKC